MEIQPELPPCTKKEITEILRGFDPKDGETIKAVLSEMNELVPSHPKQLQLVGKGGMGSVHLFVLPGNQTCVVKLPASEGVVSEIHSSTEIRNISAIQATIRAMRCVTNASVVQSDALLLPWIYHTPTTFPLLFMPLVGTSLHEATYTRQWDQLGRVCILREILPDIADGLCVLHSMNRVHGDFKPANVLVQKTDKWRAKISDFGSSVEIDGNYYGTARCSYPFRSPWAHERGCELMPELVDDMWALGCVIAEVATGAQLFRMINDCSSEEEETWRSMQQHVDFLSEGCEERKTEIDRCLASRNANRTRDRLTIEQINACGSSKDEVFTNPFTFQDSSRRGLTRSRFLHAEAEDLLMVYESLVCASPECSSALDMFKNPIWGPFLNNTSPGALTPAAMDETQHRTRRRQTVSKRAKHF